MGVHSNPQYLRLKSELEDTIRALAHLIAEEDTDGEQLTSGSMIVSGWILGIMVTGTDENEEFDDVLYESNEGLNNYTAVGLATVQKKYYIDGAIGMFNDDEDEEES